MLDGGDPEKMGFAQSRCFNCGEERRIAFSCKSSFCLSCAKPHTEQWTDFISRRLLPGVTYRHIVLTVPGFLRLWFYRNPDLLLSPLMKAGHACLVDLFETCAGDKLDIGTIIVLQTAGRPGNYNPHLHILGTGGGIDPKGDWKPISYIPFEVLHRKWQFHLLSMLRDIIPDPNIEKDIDRGWRQYPKGFVAFVDKGEVPPGGQGLATYLAKYVVSPPILSQTHRAVRRRYCQLPVPRPRDRPNRAHHPALSSFYRQDGPTHSPQRLSAYPLLRPARQRPLCRYARNHR